MLGTASWLTLATLAGMVAGFAREWLLVAHWGAGARTDAFLVVMFLPEALRAMLAAGVLASAALPLWHRRCGTGVDRHSVQPADAGPGSLPSAVAWLGDLSAGLLLVSLLAALALALAAPWWVSLVGHGLDAERQGVAVQALHLLAWSLPGQLLHALWSVPLQARGRYMLSGAGSLLYNLPALVWLYGQGPACTESGLALAYVVGSLAMAASVLPGAWQVGLRAHLLRPSLPVLAELWHRVSPLLVSAVSSQGLLLLERVVAGYLGAGTLTLMNLARKLFNVPTVALASVAQVLLGLMSRQEGAAQLGSLKRGLAVTTLLILPAALGLMIGGKSITSLLFARVTGTEPLAELLAVYGPVVLVGGWAMMLARYCYSMGDTRTPLRCELIGQALQALSMPLLAWLLGSPGLVQSQLLGGLLTTVLLVQHGALWKRAGLETQALVATLTLGLCVAARPWHSPYSTALQLGLATLAGAMCLAALAWWLRPWRTPAG